MYAQPISLFFTNILRAPGNQYLLTGATDKQNLAAYFESPSHACFLKTLASPSPITTLTFRFKKHPWDAMYHGSRRWADAVKLLWDDNRHTSFVSRVLPLTIHNQSSSALSLEAKDSQTTWPILWFLKPCAGYSVNSLNISKFHRFRRWADAVKLLWDTNRHTSSSVKFVNQF